MLITTQVEVTDVPIRVRNKIMRDANRWIMVNHVNKTMGKKFKNVPETRPGGAYGYFKRSEKYTKRKLRTKGHTLPNVLSGEMRRNVRKNLQTKVTATKDRSRFKLKNYFKLEVRRRDELETITIQEQNEMRKMHYDRVMKEARNPKNMRKRKRKV